MITDVKATKYVYLSLYKKNLEGDRDIHEWKGWHIDSRETFYESLLFCETKITSSPWTGTVYVTSWQGFERTMSLSAIVDTWWVDVATWGADFFATTGGWHVTETTFVVGLVSCHVGFGGSTSRDTWLGHAELWLTVMELLLEPASIELGNTSIFSSFSIFVSSWFFFIWVAKLSFLLQE